MAEPIVSSSSPPNLQSAIKSIPAIATSPSNPQPSTSSLDHHVNESPSTSFNPNMAVAKRVSITPEDVCPYPKAGPRKRSNRGRKPGRSHIATATPEKADLSIQVTPCKIAQKKPKFNLPLTAAVL